MLVARLAMYRPLRVSTAAKFHCADGDDRNPPVADIRASKLVDRPISAIVSNTEHEPSSHCAGQSTQLQLSPVEVSSKH